MFTHQVVLGILFVMFKEGSTFAQLVSMRKFSSEISKKILSEASTLTRASSVMAKGAVNSATPILGTFDAKVIGYVKPPSVESRIFTEVHSTGARLVLATSQFTVTVSPAVQTILVFGLLTTNGPAFEVTSTSISS